jgi:hypothetical protein
MSPVREKGRHKVRHRLGADSSISLQRSSRLRPSLTVVISCHSTSIRSISTIHVPDRSSLSFIERPYTFAPRPLPVHPWSSIALPRSSIVASSIISLIIPHWKRATAN